MELKEYTTEFLEDIVKNINSIKRELSKRQRIEITSQMKVGDVYYSHNKSDFSPCLYKITSIEGNEFYYDELIVSRIQIQYADDCMSYLDDTNIASYQKLENPEVFDALLNIANQYNDEVETLHANAYYSMIDILKEKQLIGNE